MCTSRTSIEKIKTCLLRECSVSNAGLSPGTRLGGGGGLTQAGVPPSRGMQRGPWSGTRDRAGEAVPCACGRPAAVSRGLRDHRGRVPGQFVQDSRKQRMSTTDLQETGPGETKASRTPLQPLTEDSACGETSYGKTWCDRTRDLREPRVLRISSFLGQLIALFPALFHLVHRTHWETMSAVVQSRGRISHVLGGRERKQPLGEGANYGQLELN